MSLSQNGFGTNTCVANLTSGFIDLATYDELEKYMYGGPDATAYFVRETRKSTWFTQCPVTLARSNGTPEFGAEWSCTISRAGDYLLGTWLHVVTPEISLKVDHSTSVCIAWTPNFMHALVKECCITFNDLVAARFDGTHLDFWAAFTTPASKADGYRKMIGAQLPTYGHYIPSYALNLPLPFFYTRDSGVALPTAALPYNEMRINFVFRQWQEMLLTFREYGNCENASGPFGPAMAVEHPQTQAATANGVAVVGIGGNDQQVVSLTGAAATANTNLSGPALLGLKVGGFTTAATAGPLTATSHAGRIVGCTKFDGSPFAVAGGPPTQAELNDATGGLALTVVTVSGIILASTAAGNLTNIIATAATAAVYTAAQDISSIAAGNTVADAVPQSIFMVPTAADATSFSQVGAQAQVSRVNYASPYFCKRNCPVVSVAADQLSIGAAINGFEVDSSGNVVPGTSNLGGNNVGNGNTETPIDLFNDKYAHMNYDAEVCAKCLMLGSQDTGLFNQTLLKQPSLGGNAVQVWANYAIVSNEERKRMACAPRDILIEQVQTTPSASFGGQTPFPLSSSSASNQQQGYDIRFSHAVKVLFFGAKNTTFKTVHSNYSTGIPCLSKQDCGGCLSIQSLAGQGFGGRGGDQLMYALGLTNGPNSYSLAGNAGDGLTHNSVGVQLQTAGSAVGAQTNIHSVCDVVTVNSNVVGCCNAQDPMMNANLVYENTQRLGLMSSDYYAQVQPYYHAPTIPSKDGPVFCPEGYHMYSYSLDFICLDPLGSTNYGKLTNVAINATPASNWGRSACVSNESLQVLYDKNGNGLPANFGKGAQPTVSGKGGRGGLRQGLNSYSIDDLLLQNVGANAVAATQVQGGLGLIDSKRNTQLFSFQFVCTAVNNNIIRISGGALGFPVL